MASYLLERSPTVRRDRLESKYEHLRYARLATAAQRSPEFGPYDGLVPAAGAKQLASILIPTGPALEPTSITSTTQPVTNAVSASRLETLGTCPRKYFFQRALGIRAPDLWERETNAWLSPLQLGSLIHELFEEFLLDLTARDLVPNVARDSQPLQSRLDELLRKWAQQIPVHSQDAFDRRRNELMDTCEIFLMKEQEYCQQRQARPWIVEASLGSPRKDRSIQTANPVINQATNPLDCDTPIELALTDGRALRLAGRIDRIDRLLITGSERYVIWDYKSGSNFGYSQSDPFAQGRKLQPFLYVGMLRHRFEQLDRDPDAVEGFGYFFPSPRCEGLRLEWSTVQLSRGEEIIRQLCDLLTSGTFIATNKKEDCGFCDYAPVCGPPEDLVVISEMKAQAPGNPTLDAWRSLRHG
ncbi:MAG: PD-(D/E)XK nuclease family protein [Pirellulaceae bacterium]|nr:PD-(D/E)XK nuclease family protein [Pirellulaceae bacterium]